MSLLTVDDLKALIDQLNSPCVSIYMPTVRAGAETQQNSIRFKNLIKQAEAQLQAYGLDHTEALNLLQPAMALDQEAFWQNQDQGLAIFIAPGALRYYQLPLMFNELVVVGDRAHLKPLLPILTGDGTFYILALSQKQVRFFEATRYSVIPIELEGIPQSLDEALQYDETAKEGQFRISTYKGGTNNAAQQAGSFHGQGSPDRDQHQKDILEFCHAINRGVQKYLNTKRGPLVLAGLEQMISMYREANSYQHLVDESIDEKPEILTPDDLHSRSWAIVEPMFAQTQQDAIEHYRELTATGKTSTDVKESVAAAYYGRIEQLFVAVGLQQWGSFDPQANAVILHPEAEPGDEDLLNSAAIQTLLNGGTVYAVEPEDVPDAAPLAAVFRY